MTDLRYPIGKFEAKTEVSDGDRRALIQSVAQTPERLQAALEGLTQEQLCQPYRLEGWTVRQVTHHLPDSHLNGYIRFKLALTEDQPTVRTYHEEIWAQLEEGGSAPHELSLRLLESLHHRWTFLLLSLTRADFQRTLKHPDWGVMSLDALLQLYEWHGRHHIAHITSLRQLRGW